MTALEKMCSSMDKTAASYAQVMQYLSFVPRSLFPCSLVLFPNLDVSRAGSNRQPQAESPPTPKCCRRCNRGRRLRWCGTGISIFFWPSGCAWRSLRICVIRDGDTYNGRYRCGWQREFSLARTSVVNLIKSNGESCRLESCHSLRVLSEALRLASER